MQPAEGERREAIEAAFTRVVALRRAFDALDAASNDDALSPAEVATLDDPSGPAADGAGADGRSAMPLSAERLPALAALIGRYMRQRGKSHLAFAEMVLLCASDEGGASPRRENL